VTGVGHRTIRQSDELLDQTAGDRGREQGVPGCHHCDRVEKLGRPGVLEQEPAGASAEGLVDELVLVERRQHEYVRAGASRVGHDPSCCLEAVHPRHSDVHQDHVGSRT
jgi:hypothetical protein